MELIIVLTLEGSCEDLIKLNHIQSIKHCAWHVIGSQMVAMLLLLSFLILLLLLDAGTFYYPNICNCFLVSLPSLSNLIAILHHSSHTIIFDSLVPNYQSILFYSSGLLSIARNITQFYRLSLWFSVFIHS